MMGGRPIREALPVVDAAAANLRNIQRSELYIFRTASSLPKIVASMFEILCSAFVLVVTTVP
jgi:hypothetical protein